MKNLWLTLQLLDWHYISQINFMHLNLLPPQERETIRINYLNRKIIILGGYFIFILFIFSIVLSVIFTTINFKAINAQNNLKETQNKLIFEGFENIQNQLKNANDKIKNVHQIQQNYKYYSVVIEEIIKIIPPDIKITAISANQNQFEIKGFAPNRNLVADLKTSLEQSSHFKEINSPLANFLQAENVNFTFSFKIEL